MLSEKCLLMSREDYHREGLKRGMMADFKYFTWDTSLIRKSNKISTTEKVLVRIIIQLEENLSKK